MIEFTLNVIFRSSLFLAACVHVRDKTKVTLYFILKSREKDREDRRKKQRELEELNARKEREESLQER